MTNQNFINIIKNECQFLENDGYQLKIIDRNIWYEKKTDKEGLRISFGWTEYDCLWISGLTANKRFNEVETLINKAINIDLIDLYTIHISPNPKDIPQGLKYIESSENINFEIYTYEESLLFIEFLKSFYYRTVVPFFEEYESLTKIIYWLNEKDISEHLNLIVSTGNTLMLRKLIVMKLNNDTKFQDLYLRYNNYLAQKSIEKESPYVDMYKKFKQLISFFEK
ncbi:hypothetical protein [Flavobacterium sp.]|uniref:hypothetical protein n=1 Tax=Flavobacterium sp. TaxID=239 RepID=UPI0022C1AEFC|nr:hypothetical protein [Flavobacterium sp.]MCZ8230346.1 hypothetical protein [Flavobacterium sp.]